MDSTLFGQKRIDRILWRLAPPVRLAQLVQPLYNIVDSFFVRQYSEAGLPALSIVYPLQLMMIALAVGTGVGLNTAIARYHGIGDHERAQRIAGNGLPLALAVSPLFGPALMTVGTLCFEVLQAPMLRVFTADPEVIRIGTYGFRWIGPSFLPMVTSLLFPVFFQAVGQALKSSLLTVIRSVGLFVPLGYIFSRFGLNRFWLTFVCTEVLTSVVGLVFYRRFVKTSGSPSSPVNEGFCAARE